VSTGVVAAVPACHSRVYLWACFQICARLNHAASILDFFLLLNLSQLTVGVVWLCRWLNFSTITVAVWSGGSCTWRR